MNYIWQEFKQDVSESLQALGVEEKNVVLENPPENISGDLAFPCFVLAKQKKKSPNEVAIELKNKIELSEILDKCEVNGPYLNFFVKKDVLVTRLIEEIKQAKDCYGSLNKKSKKIGVEYLSPNSNKPLTVGHARNGSLGTSLIQILKFAGYDVVSMILYNDRGVHICKSMLAYQKWGENKTPEELNLKPDHMIGKYYVMFGKKAEKDESLNQEVQEMLKKWEDGDEEVIKLWKKLNKWFFEGVNKTLDRVGIKFDKEYLESDIYKNGKEIVEKAVENKKAYRLDDGAVEVDLEDVKLDKKILLRADGTTVYMVQDLYLAKNKFDDYDLDKSIYVVGSEQNYHFEVLFELLDRFGIADKNKTYHMSYALVNDASGKRMSSRTGEVEKWDDLLDELHQIAKVKILERNEDIEEKVLEERAEVIAQAALKFVMLNQDTNKTISFDKSEVLRFDGETGPYILYTYARINSILDKVDFEEEAIELGNIELDEIMISCSKLSDATERASREYNPAIVSQYLYDLCKQVNNFYHLHRVIDLDDDKKKNARASMLRSCKQVIANCANMLGIELLERM